MNHAGALVATATNSIHRALQFRENFHNTATSGNAMVACAMPDQPIRSQLAGDVWSILGGAR
jgi:hypothetical protein